MLIWPHLEVSVPHAIGQGGPSPVEQEEVVEESRARSNVQVTRSGLDTQLGKGTDSWELKEMGQNSAGTQTHVCFAELQSYNRHFNKTYGAWIDICPWETSRKEGMAVTGKDPASLQDQMNKNPAAKERKSPWSEGKEPWCLWEFWPAICKSTYFLCDA